MKSLWLLFVIIYSLFISECNTQITTKSVVIGKLYSGNYCLADGIYGYYVIKGQSQQLTLQQPFITNNSTAVSVRYVLLNSNQWASDSSQIFTIKLNSGAPNTTSPPLQGLFLQGSTPISIDLPNLSCNVFKGPIQINGGITSFQSIFNPHTTRSVFILNVVNTPIDSLGCIAYGRFACAMVPMSLDFIYKPTVTLKTIASCFVRLSPKPGSFSNWNPIIVGIYDNKRPWVPQINVTVSFAPGVVNQPTTTTLINNIRAIVPNATAVTYTYASSYFDIYLEASAKNSELMFYLADQSGDPDTDSTPVATYKSLLGNSDNVLLHFPISFQQNVNATNTILFNLASHSFDAIYKSYYPYNRALPPTNQSSSIQSTSSTSFMVESSFQLQSIGIFTIMTGPISTSAALNLVTILDDDIPLSFGIVDGSSTRGYSYNVTIPYSNSIKQVNPRFVLPHNILAFTLPGTTSPSPSSTLPTLLAFTNYKVKKLDTYSFVFQVETNQPVDIGILAIAFTIGSNIVYVPAQITNIDLGLQFNTFEGEVNITMMDVRSAEISIVTRSLQVVTLYQGDAFRSDSTSSFPITVDSYPVFDIELSNITHWQWVPNVIDVSQTDQKTTLYFNITNADVNAKPRVLVYNLHISDPTDLDQYQIGSWNSSIQMYQVDLIVPAKTYPGPLFYQLATGIGRPLFGEFIALNPLIGDNATCQVECSFGDQMGPIVRNVSAEAQSVLISNVGGSNEIAWILSIEDQSTGFYYNSSNSYAIITSKLDPHHHIEPINLISGTPFEGLYRVQHTISGRSPNDTYYLDLVMVDYLGNLVNSIPSSKTSETSKNLDPFLYLVNSPTQAQRSIQVYTSLPLDTNPPVLTTFQLLDSNAIDIVSDNRTIYFSFIVQDLQSGVSQTHLPNINLMSWNGKLVSNQSTIDTIYNQSTISYICQITLPYGFGLGDKPLISLYGMVDNYKNIGGMSSEMLKLIGLTNSIDVVAASLNPVILSTSSITKSGGSLTIRGRKLGSLDSTLTVVQANLDNNGWVTVPTLFQSGIVVVTSISSFTTSCVIRISAGSPSKQSNDFVILPTTYIPVIRPTPSDSSSGSPNECPQASYNGGLLLPCAGHGTCQLDGSCSCFSPWSGPICLNRPDPNSNTTVDPNKPNVVTNTTGNIFAGVSVVEVQEINLVGTTIKSFPLTSWTFLNTSNQDSNTFIYISPIDNTTSTSSSSIVVRIQYFSNDTTIVFANETMAMNQGSIKYSITLSSYAFQSPLNTLRVILSVDMASGDQECSSLQQSDGDNLQWIKVKMGDKSLFGRFLKKGYIDGRISTISNRILNQNTDSQSSKTLVSMDIQYYRYNAIIDPDFSMLVEPSKLDCTEKKDNGMSKTQLAGIILGTAGAVLVVAFILFMVIRKKLAYKVKILLESRKHNRKQQQLDEL